MLKLKTFVRKTRRGKILKVVREHYLRDDLSCGIAGCSACQKNASDDGEESAISPILDKRPTSICDLYPKDHFLVLVCTTNLLVLFHFSRSIEDFFPLFCRIRMWC